MTPLFGFLLGWAVRTAVVSSTTALICWALRKAPASTHNLLWRCSLATCLLSGLLLAAGQRISLPVLPATSTPAANRVQIWNASRSSLNPASVNPNTEFVGGAPLKEASEPLRLTPQYGPNYFRILCLAYFLGVAFYVIRWLISLASVRRICRLSEPYYGSRITLKTSATELRVPIALGFVRPVVVLPADVESWPTPRLEAVLLHEWSHLERQDWIWQTAGVALTALQWFNPAAWLLTAKLRATAEECADNAVLAAGFTASAYASELLSFASILDTSNAAAVGMARRQGISDRMKNILAPNRNRTHSSRKVAAGIGFCFCTIGITLAVCTPTTSLLKLHSTPTAAEEDTSTPGTYTASFSNGVKVKVLFIGPGSASDLPVWNPDGSPSHDTPKAHGSTYGGGSPGNAQFYNGKNRVAVCFNYMGMPDNITTTLRPNPMFRPAKLAGRLSNGGSSGGSPNALNCIYQFEMPQRFQKADLEVPLGVGPFHKVAEYESGKGNFRLKVTTRQTHQKSGHTDAKGTLVEKDEVVPIGELSFELPQSAMGKEWRLAAYDKDGKLPTLLVSDDGWGYKLRKLRRPLITATCFADPDSISRYELEVRDYEWVKLKGLHLYPNTAAK